MNPAHHTVELYYPTGVCYFLSFTDEEVRAALDGEAVEVEVEQDGEVKRTVIDFASPHLTAVFTPGEA